MSASQKHVLELCYQVAPENYVDTALQLAVPCSGFKIVIAEDAVAAAQERVKEIVRLIEKERAGSAMVAGYLAQPVTV